MDETLDDTLFHPSWGSAELGVIVTFDSIKKDKSKQNKEKIK